MENVIEQLRKKYTLESTIDSVKGIVTPVFMRLSLGGVVDKFNSLPEEYRTDWSKLLMDVDKSYGVISTLVKSLYGLYGGNSTSLCDLDMGTNSDVSMIFANTPNKSQQTKLVNLIQESLGLQYIVKLINGDETTNREAEKEAKRVVAQAKKLGKKVVLVSNDMASRSFSVSEIDTVLLFFDRGLYSTITQKISRVLTPGKTFKGGDKTHGNVISLSLDPNREDVSPIDEYIVYEAEKVDVNDLNDGIKRVLRSVQLFTNGEGESVEIEKDIYAEKLINSSSLIRLGSESSKVENVITNDNLVKLMLGVELTQGEKERLLGVDSSTVIRDKKEKTNDKKGKGKDKVEDIRKKLKECLKNIVENAVEISEINNCESDDIIETLDMINEKGYCEEVVFEVGMDCMTVKEIILLGGVSRKLINTIISSYNHNEVALF
jgi:hypothetical protein